MSDVLSIDLGTGTVIGLVSREQAGRGTLVARKQRAHHPDAVREGRIVDRDLACETVKQVLEDLEEEVSLESSRAHFAISSRELHRQEVTAEFSHPEPTSLSETTMKRLTSRRELDLPEGYFPISEQISYRLVDGTRVESFSGQYGRTVSARWVVHSLPMADLESRRAVIEEAGLMPGSLVLEPTAAARAAFPEEDLAIRLMLLDFGAGTLDATLLARSSVEGVTSIAGSGDQLTRAVQEKFGVSFEAARECKHNMSVNETFETEDWKGDSLEIPYQEVLSTLTPILRKQLQALEEQCHDWEPEQICLAGGGAQFPFLPRMVSNVFGVGEGDIVHQPPRIRLPLEDPDEFVERSSDYTVVGIQQSVLTNRSRELIRFEMNGRECMRAMKEAPTLRELAREEGIEELDAEREAVMVAVDGETHTRRPEGNDQVEFYCDGEEVEPEYEVRSGDHIQIVPPDVEEEGPRFEAGDFLSDEILSITWNNQRYRQSPELVDEEGNICKGDDRLEDGRSYDRREQFDLETIVRRLQAVDPSVPERPLVLKNGHFVEEENFEVGESIELRAGVNPKEYGLGQVRKIQPKDRPCDIPLT